MVHQIIKSKYSLFAETMILTLLILIIGFALGMLVEYARTKSISDDYNEFEVTALDLKLQNYYYQIMDEASCDKALEQNLIFADQIYDTGLLLEKYEDANELSESILIEKKKYVLLKTELWLNSVLLREKCKGKFHTVVYFYTQYEDLIKRAEQKSISDILGKLKKEKGNNIILIPIAGDLGLDIVNFQKNIYNITYLPSILLDEKTLLEGFHSVEELEKYLK